MMAAYNAIRSRRFTQKQSACWVMSWRSNTCASCAILPTSTGVTGHTRDATMAIIVDTTVNTNTPSFVMVVDATMTSKMTRRPPPSARTRISSPVTCTAKMLNTCTKSSVPTCATRKHHPRRTQTMATSVAPPPKNVERVILEYVDCKKGAFFKLTTCYR
jgi:hypothetical protein